LAVLTICVAPTNAAYAGFTEVAQFGTGLTISVAWGDFDQDGDLDLAVGNTSGVQNRLYVNKGDNTFTERDEFGTDNTFAVVWADFDNDGDLDMAVGNGVFGQNQIYLNNGDDTFSLGPTLGGRSTIALAWADFDLDGDLDCAVGNGILGAEQNNRLFVNGGDGTFSSYNEFGGLQSCAMAWGDFDNDGDPDLAVGNGGFNYTGQNYLYVNNGDATFTQRAEFGVEDTASLAWGDYDNDGDLDLAVGNWESGPSHLYVNNGDDTFTQQLQFGNRDTNTLAWGDADNDGWLDMAVGNGDFQHADTNFIYVNLGDGGFAETAELGLGSTDGVAWGDYDGDGDLDVAVGNEHHPTTNYLYVNDTDNTDYLVIHLIGHFHDLGPGYSNRDGVGAKVAVYEAGFLGQSDHLLGYREIAAQGGFACQNAMDAHFGLPGVTTVDVRITWPGSNGSNIVQDVEGVLTGQTITVNESDGISGVEGGSMDAQEFGRFQAIPNPMKHSTRIQLSLPLGTERRVEIFNIQGQKVRVLNLAPEDREDRFSVLWDGRGEDGKLVSAGVYLVRAPAAGTEALGRIVLLR
jgi:hypothetical protein